MIIIFVVLFLIIVIIVSSSIDLTMKLDQKFYDSNIFPYLDNIKLIRNEIIQEVDKVNNWKDWVEKDLYGKKDGQWKIFPFYAFDMWMNKNCEMMPILSNFIRNIPGLKLATLSKLSPGMYLNSHQGWKAHSNSVLRCHYGIKVPEKSCYVGVEENSLPEIKYHKNDEWLIFDDSKIHWAANTSQIDRIILIVDVERPKYIKEGSSQIGDTKELLEIIKYFKNE